MIADALRQTGQRGILTSGWGGLGQVDLGDDVLLVDDIPYDWLFPRVAAAIHHGGAGTTAASLRAGIQTFAVPTDGDQTFWARRIAALGVGPPPFRLADLTRARLAAAIRILTKHPSIRLRAAELGARIRQEDGVAHSVRIIEQHLQSASRASGRSGPRPGAGTPARKPAARAGLHRGAARQQTERSPAHRDTRSVVAMETSSPTWCSALD
jgi:UDP:flavonoid glycosyltransferase YjiC (YdhE family)